MHRSQTWRSEPFSAPEHQMTGPVTRRVSLRRTTNVGRESVTLPGSTTISAGNICPAHSWTRTPYSWYWRPSAWISSRISSDAYPLCLQHSHQPAGWKRSCFTSRPYAQNGQGQQEVGGWTCTRTCRMTNSLSDSRQVFAGFWIQPLWG